MARITELKKQIVTEHEYVDNFCEIKIKAEEYKITHLQFTPLNKIRNGFILSGQEEIESLATAIKTFNETYNNDR